MRRLLLLVLALCLPASPAAAEWRRAVSPHFVIYSQGSPRELQSVAEKLERFDALLRMLSPAASEESRTRLTVFMPSDADAIGDLLNIRATAGFYRPSVAGSIAVVPRRVADDGLVGGIDPETILFHEYAHHFMLQNYSKAYPAWFVEGYAELVSTTRFEDDGSIMLGNPALHRTQELSLPPLRLRTLLFNDWWSLRGDDADTYYAQAWYLTHYLVFSGERRGQLTRYLSLLAEGIAPAQAVEQAFGGLQSLDRDFGRYRRRGVVPGLRLSFERAPRAPAIALETLRPAEERLVWRTMLYMRGIEPGDVAGFARGIRRAAAGAQDDPAVLQLLADAEYLAGDLAAATRAVDALLALRPNAARALLRKGLIELRRLEDAGDRDPARWSAARSWVARANRADLNDPLPMLEYYRSYERQGLPITQNAALALMGAFQLAPQDFGVRMLLGQQLIRERRYEEAVIALEPIAYSPHASPGREEALRLIQRIRPVADGAELAPA